MKNIQIIDDAINCVYDIFAATDKEFEEIFGAESDIAFIDEIYENGDKHQLDDIFTRIWQRRVVKVEANGIHGIIFYELKEKKIFYLARRDEEARNPDGSDLR